MKTILTGASVGPNAHTDEYGLFRSEGRIPINWAFGLSEMGYYVNIVGQGFINKTYISGSGGAVQLSTSPVKDHYDAKIFVDNFAGDTKCDKEISFINYTHETNRATKIGTLYVTAYRNMKKFLQEETKRPVEYLPVIHPITNYHKGFKPFNCDLCKMVIHVGVFYSPYDKNTYCMDEFIKVLKRIKEIFNRNDQKVVLHFQVSNEMKREARHLFKFGDEIKFIPTMNYLDYLKFIETIDFVILKGTQFLAQQYYDVLSLGKPIIYISEHIHQTEPFRNQLFDNLSDIIVQDDNELSINRRIDNFIENPKIMFDKFRKSIEDSDFKNWQKFAEKLFKRNGELPIIL